MVESEVAKSGQEYLTVISNVLLRVDPRSLETAIEVLTASRGRGTIYTAGNGGSASTAEHLASDLTKWANLGWDNLNSLRAISLNSNMPQISALTNDAGWSQIYVEMLKSHRLSDEDIFVAFSVHGGTGEDKAGPYSQNLNNAIRYARSAGAKTIGFSGFDGGRFNEICNISVVVPAESTPIVEGLHSVLSHIVCDMLRK